MLGNKILQSSLLELDRISGNFQYLVGYRILKLSSDRISGNVILYIIQLKSLLTKRHRHYILNSWFIRLLLRCCKNLKITWCLCLTIFYNTRHHFASSISGYPAGYWISSIINKPDIGHLISGKICIRPNPSHYNVCSYIE